MIKPLNDYVILEPVIAEKKTASGIILTESSKEQPSMGKIIALGDGAYVDGKRIPLTLKINDQVIYKKYATTEIKHDGKEYLLIKEEDVLAIVE